MSDLHERFAAWLTDGARGELPRDAALHASACDACRRDATAIDALLAVDPGAAPIPAIGARVPQRAATTVRVLRAAAGVATVLLLAASVGIGAGGFLEQRAQPSPTTSESPTAGGEGILGGAGGPIPPSDPPSGSPEPSAMADASEDVATASPIPRAAATPLPVVTPRPTAVVTPPIGTPRPGSSSGATPAPTAVPSVPPSATPNPTPKPTAVPTPEPTPVPTPTPMPQCSDGIDNDGDGLIDFGLDPLENDPGCLSAADDDESDL